MKISRYNFKYGGNMKKLFVRIFLLILALSPIAATNMTPQNCRVVNYNNGHYDFTTYERQPVQNSLGLKYTKIVVKFERLYPGDPRLFDIFTHCEVRNNVYGGRNTTW